MYFFHVLQSFFSSVGVLFQIDVSFLAMLFFNFKYTSLKMAGMGAKGGGGGVWMGGGGGGGGGGVDKGSFWNLHLLMIKANHDNENKWIFENMPGSLDTSAKGFWLFCVHWIPAKQFCFKHAFWVIVKERFVGKLLALLSFRDFQNRVAFFPISKRSELLTSILFFSS